MMPKLKIKTLLLASSFFALTACGMVADLFGQSSAELNARAASAYQAKMRQERQIDLHSPTAQMVHQAFARLRPYADAMNQTGQVLQWEMTVIRSNVENAWAMPGGKMAFYTALAEKNALNEAEIAAIVGHEMAHALQEHSKKQLGGAILSSIAMQFGKEMLQSQTGMDPAFIDLGADLLQEFGLHRPYSRQHEYEADAIGMRLMAQAGYDPQAALTVWEKIRARSHGAASIAQILSTHPNHEARIAAMQKLLPANRQWYEQAQRF